MFRFESLSPLLVAWGVALAFAGILMIMSLTSDQPANQQQVSAARTTPAPAAGPERNPPPADPPQPTTLQPTEKPVTKPITKPATTPPPTTKPVTEPVVKKATKKAKKAKKDATKPAVTKDAPPPVRTVAQITRALQQPIASFVQEKPVSARRLLRVVEELAGVEFRLDDDLADAAGLAKPLGLKLQRTTVGEVLDAVLKAAGLAREVRAGYIRVMRPAAGAGRP